MITPTSRLTLQDALDADEERSFQALELALREAPHLPCDADVSTVRKWRRRVNKRAAKLFMALN